MSIVNRLKDLLHSLLRRNIYEHHKVCICSLARLQEISVFNVKLSLRFKWIILTAKAFGLFLIVLADSRLACDIPLLL